MPSQVLFLISLAVQHEKLSLEDGSHSFEFVRKAVMPFSIMLGKLPMSWQSYPGKNDSNICHSLYIGMIVFC